MASTIAYTNGLFADVLDYEPENIVSFEGIVVAETETFEIFLPVSTRD